MRKPSPSRCAGRLTLAAAFVFAAGPVCGQNLFSDPHFASGLGGWFSLTTGVPPATFVRDPGPGADGAPGFAALTGGTPSPVLYAVRGCVPVQAGVVYSFGGNVRFRTAQISSAVFWLRFFTDGACLTGVPPPPLVPASTPVDSGQPGAWRPSAGTGTLAPAGAASASLDLILFGIGASGTTEIPSVDFDDVYVGRAGTVEPPVPVPFLSRAGVLALGIALALLGTFAARSAR